MPRTHFYHTMWRKNPDTGDVEPLEGIEATTVEVDASGSEGDDATVFAGRTGVTLGDTTSNENGEISFWVDDGDYNVHLTDPELPARMDDKTIGISGISGAPGGIQLAQLPASILSALPQPGDLKAVAYLDPDDGWLLCDGSPVSRITYADLFDRIGTNFNTGDESGSQFRLPDFREAFMMGVGGAVALGDEGGAAAVTLSAAQSGLPNHNHGGASGGASKNLNHEHDMIAFDAGGPPPASSNMIGRTVVLGGTAGGGTARTLPLPINNGSFWYALAVGGVPDLTDLAHTHTISAQTAAASSSHENRPPFVAVNIMIKY